MLRLTICPSYTALHFGITLIGGGVVCILIYTIYNNSHYEIF